MTLADLLASEEAEKASYREKGSLGDDMGIAVDFLDNREKKVISMRFGLGNRLPMKLEEISNELKVSAERVRQIEARSLRKLRAIILRNGKLDFRKLDQFVNLDMSKKITKEEVNKAYVKIQKKIHPDISPETSRLSSIVNEAKDIVLNDIS